MEYTNKAYLLIGGNVGNSVLYLEQAVGLLQSEGVNVVKKSAVYETAAWGNQEQRPFLNQALEVGTNFSAERLMVEMLLIEEKMGRVRKEKYGPRIIDIDLLFFNEEVRESTELTIPHKELQNRRFVLQPLSDIAPLLVHPVLKKSIQQLLLECQDALAVRKISNDAL